MKKELLFLLLLLVVIFLSANLFAETMDDCFEITETSIEQIPDHTGDLEPGQALPGDTIIYCFALNVSSDCVSSGDLIVNFYLPNIYTEDEVILTSFLGADADSASTVDLSSLSSGLIRFIIDESLVDTNANYEFCCTLTVNEICGDFPIDIQLQANVSIENLGVTVDSRWINGPIVMCRPGIVCYGDIRNGMINCDSCPEGNEEVGVNVNDTISLTLNICNYPLPLVATSGESLLAYFEISYPLHLLIPDSLCDTSGFTDGVNWNIDTCVSGDDTTFYVWWLIDSLDTGSCVCLNLWATIDDTFSVTDTTICTAVGVYWNENPFDSCPNPFPNYFCDTSRLSNYNHCAHSLCYSFSYPDLKIELNPILTDTLCLSCDYPIIVNYTITNEGGGIANAPFTASLYLVDSIGEMNFLDSVVIENSLPNGSSIEGEFYPTFDFCGVDTVLYAFVDIDSIVEESDNGNNADSVSVCVGINYINLNFQYVDMSGEPIEDTCGNSEDPECDRALLYLSVTDQNWVPVSGLATGCWETPDRNIWDPLLTGFFGGDINEDLYSRYNPRIIEGFANAPLSVILVMDNSGSIASSDLNTIKDAACNFVSDTSCAEEFAIVKFSNTADVILSFTDDTGELQDSIRSNYPSGATAMYDALYLALSSLGGLATGPCVIILFTDGVDNMSSHNFEEIVTLSSEVGIPICVIDVNSGGSDNLTDLARSTGGFYLWLREFSDLEFAYRTVCDMAHGMYILAFDVNGCDDTMTVSGCVSIQNYMTFDSLCTDSDSIDFVKCACGCDIEVHKMSSGISPDTTAGVVLVHSGDTLHYTITVENIGNDTCNCDTIYIQDILPCIGYIDSSSCFPSYVDIFTDTISIDSNIIVYDSTATWIFLNLDLLPGETRTIEYDYVVSTPESIFPTLDYQMINCAESECDDDNNLSNDYTCDTVYLVQDTIPPEITCQTSDSSWSGDTVVISYRCIKKIEPGNWNVTLTGPQFPYDLNLCSYSELCNDTEAQGNCDDTLTSEWFNFVLIAPELVADTSETYMAKICVNEEITEGQFAWLCDTCFFDINPPPCIIRIDKNYVSPTTEKNVEFEIISTHSQEVNVKIYDSGGDEVRRFQWHVNPGLNKRYWDCRDKKEKLVPSGVYFIVVDSLCNGQQLFKVAIIR